MKFKIDVEIIYTRMAFYINGLIEIKCLLLFCRSDLSGERCGRECQNDCGKEIVWRLTLKLQMEITGRIHLLPDIR